jgi:PAS domain S-box-containing protein
MYNTIQPAGSQNHKLIARANEIYRDHFYHLHAKLDRLFIGLMSAQYVFAIGLAIWLTPYTWNGAEKTVHPHVWLAIAISGLLTIPVVILGTRFPGTVASRHVIALSQVLFSSLLIHLSGGRIESHFHIFGSLAFIAAYRDWTVLVPATLVVAADHLIRGIFWPESVFGVVEASHWRWMEHAGWVIFEDLWLIIFCVQGVKEVKDIARQRAELELNEYKFKEQASALEESLQEREAIVEGALDAVVQVDSDYRIFGWNSQAARIFGWDKNEILGHPFMEIAVSENVKNEQGDVLENVLSSGISRILNKRVEIEAVRSNGEKFPIELAITPTRSNGLISFCAFVRDISDRREAETRLKVAKEQAEASNHAKSQFLANMSHEIRTPLNAIIGFTELMRDQDGMSPTEIRSHLDSVHSGGTHLLTVINDILDLSKIESGQMTYENIRFSPHQVIAETLSFMRVRALEKGITLEARWLGRVPETISSDPARFRQLLLNLVGNAMKFTEKGGVQIVARLDIARELLQVEIIDTGVGIAADKVGTLFTPFTQADVSVTRRFGGTGLGLSISRHIAQSLGGEITVSSVEGHGSTFIVTIKTGSLGDTKLLATPPTEVMVDSRPQISHKSNNLQDMNVLIVDDGETNRKLLQLILKRAAANVDMAENGQIAVDMMAVKTYDVVLMDMQMPILDGYSATRVLRKRNDKTPIVALTAHAMSGEDKKCYDAGCDFFLTKPVDRNMLLATLQQLPKFAAASPIKQDDTTETPIQIHEAIHTTAGTVKEARDDLKSELDMSDPEFRDIVMEFVKQLEPNLLKMTTALETEDWSTLSTLSHRMKGSSAMAGFFSLSLSASAVEEAAKIKDMTGIKVCIAELQDVISRTCESMQLTSV